MSDESEKEQKGRNLQLVLGILVFSLGIFAVDILIPIGVASGVGYVVVVILSLRSRDPRFTWEVASLASFLVLLGHAFSHHGGVLWMVVANRGLSLFVIWATALLSVHHKAARQKLENEKSTIELLHNASLMASQAPSVEAALEAGVKQVCAFTGWPVGHVYQREGDRLEPMLTWHFSDAKRFAPFRRLTEETCFQSGEGLPGWVLASGEPAWIAVKSMGLDLPRGEVAMQVGLEGAAAFPIFVLDEVAYIFEFFFPKSCRADENILQVMTYIGRQFGNAIERRNTLDQLYRQSEALEQSLDGIVITDLDGKIEFANSAFAEMHGYRISELMGRSAAMLHAAEHLESEVVPFIERTLEEGGDFEELTHLHKDGTLFRTRVSSSLLRDHRFVPVGIVRIVHDISEEVQLEAQLRQAQKMESVGRLAGGVAHDFNTILGAILGNCEILEGMVAAHPDWRGPVEQIHKSAERGAGLTRRLLTFSRDQVLDPQVVDLNDLLDEMLPMLRSLITEDIELSCQLATDLGRVKADVSSLQQILMNLLVNASDAMPSSGDILIETVNVVLSEEERRDNLAELSLGDYVTLSVKDSGCGMDAQTLQQIFDPFYSTKEIGKGTGLGLSMVYGIAKQHKGCVTVESVLGTGSKFSVYLPVVEEEVREAAAAVPRPVADLHGSETILLVEDDDTFRHVMKRFLKRYGYKVFDAACPADALEINAGSPTPVRLLVTDVLMPGMNGAELARKLSESNSEIRIIFMSGYSEDVLDNRAGVSGGENFLRKPFESEELIQMVRKVLDAPA